MKFELIEITKVGKCQFAEMVSYLYFFNLYKKVQFILKNPVLLCFLKYEMASWERAGGREWYRSKERL